MNNEKGITLIELLVAIVIAGIVIVPVVNHYDGDLYKTVSQEKETKVAYVAQEVMEKVRLNPTVIPKPTKPEIKKVSCYPNSNPKYTKNNCSVLLPEIFQPTTSNDFFIKVDVKPYKQNDPKYTKFYEVGVMVSNDTKVVNGVSSNSVTDQENTASFVTVVEIP